MVNETSYNITCYSDKVADRFRAEFFLLLKEEKTQAKETEDGKVIGARVFTTEVLSEKDVCDIKKWCQKNHAKCVDMFGVRSMDYRQTLFESSTQYKTLKGLKAILNKGCRRAYRCVYCGRFVPQCDIEVDHLYPVSKVASSEKLQNILKKKHCRDVNDYRNLVPACRKCNRKKGAKMGLWIFRGKLGRHEGYWGFRKFIKWFFILLLIFIIFIIRFITNNFPSEVDAFIKACEMSSNMILDLPKNIMDLYNNIKTTIMNGYV